MALRLTFCGGVGEVTGSNFLVESEKSKILIDCGMEQGSDYIEEKAYAPFPYDSTSINALVVTHAHLDHIGRIPKLVKDGFRGKICMTPPTQDLTTLILRDAASLQIENAKRHNKAPLYTDADVDTSLALIEPLDYHVEKEVAPGLSVYLRNTGHILGSASVRVRAESGETVAFSGDLGNSPSPLLPDWEGVPDADALIIESVYGDRLHKESERRTEHLRDVFKRAIEKGGAILVPAFSMERTQLMLYELSNFFSAGELPKVPVFLDSPLAIHVTAVYEKWGSTYFKKETEDEMKREGSIFEFPFLTKTLSHQESEKIAEISNPKIIIAGAGMSHGGRIGKWETMYLPDRKTTLVIAGYQSPGSPGRRMAEGDRRVRLNGHDVAVEANVEILDSWSAHADRDGLMAFAESALAGKRTKAIFACMGEPSSEMFLAQRIHDYLGARAIVPSMGQTWDITKESVMKTN